MEIDDHSKSRIRYHLGYNSGSEIPIGDTARLEEMSRIPVITGITKLSIKLTDVKLHGKQGFLPR